MGETRRVAAGGLSLRWFSDKDKSSDDEPINASERVMKIADDICGLTVLEVADLHALLKKRLRIEASAPAAFPMGMPMMQSKYPSPNLPADGSKCGPTVARFSSSLVSMELCHRPSDHLLTIISI